MVKDERCARRTGDMNKCSGYIVVASSPGDAVAKEITMGRADIGVAGMYMTAERGHYMDLTSAHSQDCAVFITLMSTALPRFV